MSLFSFKKQSTLSFVFDVRDASITLAAVRLEKGEKSEFIFCQNFSIQVKDTSDHKKYLDSMLATLDQAVLSVRKSLIKIGHTEKIKDHFFFIGSPWSISESKMIRVQKDKSYEISNTFLEKIITNEETLDENKIEKTSGDHNWQVLEEKILQSKLNGYVVEKIFGKKTTDFETEIFVSFIPYEVKNKLYSFAETKLGKSRPKHAGSSILPSYSFMRDAYPEKSDFIHVDIGSFLTDIYVVKDNLIFAVASFPSGERDILHSVVKKTKTSEHLVSSAVAIHRDENYDTVPKKDFEKQMSPQIDAWLSKLSDTLSQFCLELDVPKDLFIAPRSELSKFIAKEIADRKEKGLKVLGMDIETQLVDEQIINNQVVNGRSFINEPGIKIDVAFLSKII